METTTKRHQLVQGALSFMEETPFAACPYEQYLLEKYSKGILSIDEVLTLLQVANATRNQSPKLLTSSQVGASC